MTALYELKSFIDKVNENPEHIKNEKDRVFQFDLTDAGSIQVEIKEGRAQYVRRSFSGGRRHLKVVRKALAEIIGG